MALIRTLYPLHSGRVPGAAGVAVVFVLGVATLEQCVTGIYVWWRKRRSRMPRRRTSAAMTAWQKAE